MVFFQKVNLFFFKKQISPKFFNAVALRGNLKNIESSDISLYLGSNFHFVLYPVSQNKEFNFISVIRKKFRKEQMNDKYYFESDDFVDSLINEINSKTLFNFKNKIENIRSFPIFISDKFKISKEKNIFIVGDALYAFPPSFAQGASQSIEASKEAYEEIENGTSTYYQKRYEKIKSVNSRSIINNIVFHLSNPITIIIRNIVLKYLSKNKKFLENYLGKIYKN